MSLIYVGDLTFGYEGSVDNVFEHASFQLDTDWKLGLIGRNGRGKTTLLNLLLGRLDAHGAIHAAVDFVYFPFTVTHPERMACELAEEIVPHLEQWMLIREVSYLDVPPEALYRPFETLSNGERTKVLLACLFLRENTFLLIDEPTNHLDAQAREAVERYLKRKKGFILASHDRVLLDACVDHVLSINKRNIELQKGNYTTWQKNKERQDQYEAAENDKLKKEIRHLSEAVRRSAGWSDVLEKTKKGTRNSGLRPDRGHIGHQAAKLMKRAKVTEARVDAALEQKSRLLRNLDTADELTIRPLVHPKSILVECKDLSIAYGVDPVLQGFNFTLRQGERVALDGKNGCGKSSVLKLLVGEKISHTGLLFTASGLVVSYVPQDTSFLAGSLRGYAAARGIPEPLFLALLRKLDFAREQFEKDLSALSEGQKKKVLLAASLCEQAHLYVWDEPLNYIDLLSRVQIEELILRGNSTILFVEHDRMFREKVATRTIQL